MITVGTRTRPRGVFTAWSQSRCECYFRLLPKPAIQVVEFELHGTKGFLIGIEQVCTDKNNIHDILLAFHSLRVVRRDFNTTMNRDWIVGRITSKYYDRSTDRTLAHHALDNLTHRPR